MGKNLRLGVNNAPMTSHSSPSVSALLALSSASAEDIGADDALRAVLREAPLTELMAAACMLRDQGHGRVQTYSPKVFIPVTRLCRDYCHYCTFSRDPQAGRRAYMTIDEILAVAKAGADAGCTEALFTLGDKPEDRHQIARDELAAMGFTSTIAYVREACARVLRETGLLPHVNAGVMMRDEMASLRAVSASQGLMLESVAARLCEKGGPHYRSPDKDPTVRLENIRVAGELAIPFTTGILIGIGETRDERLDALFAIRDLHREYGHIQDVIVQNFAPKQRTPMANTPEPGMDELLWSIAAARLILGGAMSLQAPPNLSGDDYALLMDAGINDWGGVSPVTPDHVNPEAAWPHIAQLRARTEAAGRVLAKRLPVTPRHALDVARWQDSAMAKRVMALCDSEGFSREDTWRPGASGAPAVSHRPAGWTPSPVLVDIVKHARGGDALNETQIATLFSARGGDCDFVCEAADDLRREISGDVITYVVNRNINYTNICLYKCGFCAFSKGAGHDDLRGKPYDLEMDEVVRRCLEAEARGATEVCLQGGIHPSYTGQTYLDLCTHIRAAAPNLHIHAFSPLEITQGAKTLGLSVEVFLLKLKDAGLSTLPGTAAEILCDDVRAIICPDKLTTVEWLNVVETAHRVGLKTTATIMFGHVDGYEHWARHLIAIRALQKRTGGFTEFVPLAFIAQEAPLAKKRAVRNGPTFREARLMHAVARLALHPVLTNIQVSWTKMGAEGAAICLQSGANDLGGVLMNESISRAAGAEHGQEFAPSDIEALVRSLGRTPVQRTTLYGVAPQGARTRSFGAAPLAPIVQTPPRRRTVDA
jgi:FO synthase